MRLPRDTLRMSLILLGTIAVWRGIWTLMDAYLFPQHALLSALTSIIIGMLLLITTHTFPGKD